MSSRDLHRIRLVLTGGGTGGHLFPAIAVAEEFRRQSSQAEILFVGTNRRIDTESLARYGFASEVICSSGIKGKNFLQLLKAFFLLPFGYLQALLLLWRFGPDLVFGVGGYVTGPVLAAAWTLRIPAVIHEQNSVAGLANRKLGGLVDKICLSLPDSAAGFSKEKTVLTGNPVREKILQLAEKTEMVPKEVKTVLVLGGSQGSHALNILLPEALLQLKNTFVLKVVHQTGRNDVGAVREVYETAGVDAVVSDFFTDMSEAYGLADLVVSRAGATTLAEIAVLGKPAVLIPYPYAADNHQEKNGEYYVEGGGALLLKEKELDPGTVTSTLAELLSDESRLEEMALAMRRLAFPNSARDIVEVCKDLLVQRDKGE